MNGEPLVLSSEGASSYLVRRGVGISPTWIAVTLLFAMTCHLTEAKTDGGEVTAWPFTVSLVPFLLATYLALRHQFGRVRITVEDLALSVRETFGFRLTPLRIDRGCINGLWVRVEMGENGPSGYYSLMLDQDATRSRRLIGTVTKLTPLVFLCETIARDLGVPTDTRALEFA